MKAHQKIMELTTRQAEALQTATNREKQTRKAYFCSVRGLKIGKHFELVFPTINTRKARKAYEIAQAQKLTIARQYAAILSAVPVDYYEPNTATA